MGIVHSSAIEVSIAEEIKGKISSINYDNFSNIVKFSIEFYNTGSVPYKARVKSEIFNGDEVVFNAWSQEKDFMPGDKKTFDIYWHTNDPGKYYTKLKAYFGNEIKKYEKFEFLVNNTFETKNIFSIKDLRTYDNYIIFDVQSAEDVENVIVMPTNYIYGWIFEQKKIEKMAKDSSKLVILPYYPSLWKPSNVKLVVVSDGGKYYTEKLVRMEKKGSLAGFFYYIVDSIRIAIFS